MPLQLGLLVVMEPQTRLLAQGSRYNLHSRSECYGVIDTDPKLFHRTLQGWEALHGSGTQDSKDMPLAELAH